MEQNGSIFKWITFPPIVAIATISATRSLSSILSVEPVDPSLWTLHGLAFIVISALYGLFIIHGFNRGLLPLQVMAQGVLLCPLALTMGARMIQWLGVVFAICGAVVLVNAYHETQCIPDPETEAEEEEEPPELRIPVPFALTDGSGIIRSVSDAMLEAAHLSREEVLNRSISVLLAPGEETVTLNGKTWAVLQKPMEDDRYYFQLNEKAEEDKQAQAGELGLTEPATRLQTFRYAMLRLDEELYRTRRYRRTLATALIRLVFSASAEKDPVTQEAFNACCALMRDNLRTSDTAARSGERDVLLVLPECPAAAVDVVIQKLLALINSLTPSYAVLLDVTTLHVSAVFDGTEDLPSAKLLLDQLSLAMARKYTLNT